MTEPTTPVPHEEGTPDQLDLEVIRARAEAATPGPWEHVDYASPTEQPMTKEGLPSTFKGCGSIITLGKDVMGGDIAAPNGDLYPRSGYSPFEDMAFIAAARQDIPALLAELERVTRERDEARALAATCSGCQGRERTTDANCPRGGPDT